MSSEEHYLRRLRAVADADPGSLARILERFQNLNVVPRKVVAELCITGVFHVQVDVCGVADDTLAIIAAKLAQVPCIHFAHWHRV